MKEILLTFLLKEPVIQIDLNYMIYYYMIVVTMSEYHKPKFITVDWLEFSNMKGSK